MEKKLEEIAMGEVEKLEKSELGYNLSRHIPLAYLLGNAVFRPIIEHGQNTIDYYSQSPLTGTLALVGLGLAAAGTFLKGLNDISEMQTIIEGEMVEEGQYGSCRNPCYYAQNLIASGAALANPSFDSLAVLGAYFGFTEKCIDKEEEKNLIKFGDKFQQYIEKVPRWPRIKDTAKYFSKSFSVLNGGQV